MSTLYNIQGAQVSTIPTNPGAHRITRLPIIVLNLHTQCNCRCVMCDIWKRKDGRSLSLSDVRSQRESFIRLGVEQAVLTGGEPLLNREFHTIADFFKDLHIRVTLLTTGLLLRARAELIADCVDDIIVSIDGPAEIHNHIRQVPNAFQKTGDGIAAVRSIKPTLPVSCRTTVQKRNHAHLCETVDAARSVGLDSISFLPADLSSSAFNRQTPWDHARQDSVALTPAEVSRLGAEVEALIKNYSSDIRSGFIAESEGKLRRIVTRYREHLDGTPPQSPICNAPWKSAVIEVDGSLRPCFFHAPVGTIATQPLQEAINSEPAMNFRERLDVATNLTCQRCVCSLNYRA